VYIHYNNQAMGWITEELWFHFWGTRFTLLLCPDWLWGLTSCLLQWVLLAPSLRVKWPGSEVGHSLPSTAEIKNTWRYSPIHTYAFMSCIGTNYLCCTLLIQPTANVNLSKNNDAHLLTFF